MSIKKLGLVKDQNKYEFSLVNTLPRTMSFAEYQLLTPEERQGEIIVPDFPVETDESDKVEVTADGTKTYAQLLNDIFSLSDFSKVSSSSYIVLETTDKTAFRCHKLGSNYAIFESIYLGTSEAVPKQISLSENDSTYYQLKFDNTYTDFSSNTVASGRKLTLYYNSVYSIDLITNVGGGGHTIVDQSGTELAQEPNMTFLDAHLSDNSTDESTDIEIIQSVSESDWESATEDGFYDVDIEGVDIGPASDDCVEVVADGNTTRRDLFNWLFNHCDTSKIRENAYIVYSGNGRIYHYEDINNGTYIFAWESIRATTIEKVCLQLNSSTSTEIDWTLATTGNTKEENYSYKPANGYKYTLYYGNKAAVVDLQTTANRCLLNSGETVEQAINKSIIAKSGKIVSLSSDTEILSLDNGAYTVAASAASAAYIPTRYGVLVIMKSANAYGSFQFFTTDGKMYYRTANLLETTWYNSWTQA